VNSEEKNKKGKELLIKLLKSGETVDVPAQGLSMFPFLLPSDIIRVRPEKAEKLRRGQIVVYVQDHKIISHRYIKTKKGKIICKGDGLINYDLPVLPGNMLGVVVARTRKNKILSFEKASNRFTGRILSFVTPVTGVFFHYLSFAWYKWFYNKKQSVS